MTKQGVLYYRDLSGFAEKPAYKQSSVFDWYSLWLLCLNVCCVCVCVCGGGGGMFIDDCPLFLFTAQNVDKAYSCIDEPTDI